MSLYSFIFACRIFSALGPSTLIDPKKGHTVLYKSIGPKFQGRIIHQLASLYQFSSFNAPAE